MPPDREAFVHVHPATFSARSLFLSLSFRESEFIRRGGQVYQTLLPSSERLKGIVGQSRNLPAAGGCL
ncbi:MULTISPECIES: hypothetical protein [unclassified Akkermansia]|uniref:hypothetical protein n=1 Tax=unclassified Akkermansia TaxID=2608915 RepID=UPI0010223A57|nr:MULTISPECIES: hypothetical protein [unclassified Akkermansia]KAA3164885.1 hypothetical protein F2A01_03155 [Akkermansia sp. BIOML-A60]KAA3172158.1 hypothetical protein F2A07_08305 [Akkermansia sp. BIOML-A61]KAA3224440.1 hypothetical protein F1985_05380 [Akkermansia sp. BIOML-A41]KAA3148927.1 hypothetical protein F1994_07280 [Akkermansia sp. BIOML-A64]KAA3149314.1 hypothetical protein F2A16_03870 [Akkermansia sp. BIOML-A67]